MKNLKSFLIVFCILALPLVNCFATIKNFDFVADGLYRGADLDSEDDYAYLKKNHIDIVVNLRLISDDAKLCEKYNLDCVKYGIVLLPIPYTDAFFNYNTIKKAFKFIITKNAEGYNVFYHCYAGKDRTGIMTSAILLRFLTCGVKYDKEEMKKTISKELFRFGFNKYIYPFIYKTAMSWVDDVPAWICEGY